MRLKIIKILSILTLILGCYGLTSMASSFENESSVDTYKIEFFFEELLDGDQIYRYCKDPITNIYINPTFDENVDNDPKFSKLNCTLYSVKSPSLTDQILFSSSPKLISKLFEKGIPHASYAPNSFGFCPGGMSIVSVDYIKEFFEVVQELQTKKQIILDIQNLNVLIKDLAEKGSELSFAQFTFTDDIKATGE